MQNRELSADQKAQLKQQAQQFETQLASNSQDVEALEGAGVSYAQLGDFKRAEGLLSRLTAAKPQDAEAWRLLVCFQHCNLHQHCNLQPARGGRGLKHKCMQLLSSLPGAKRSWTSWQMQCACAIGISSQCVKCNLLHGSTCRLMCFP